MPGSQPVVLVVDDDRAVRDVVSELLRCEGYDVQHAADGREGLRRILNGGLDLVLLDLRLPDFDGLELCRRVRTRDGTGVPIVLLTAAEGLVGHDARAAGASDVIGKPFDVDELVQQVHRWVGERGIVARPAAEGERAN